MTSAPAGVPKEARIRGILDDLIRQRQALEHADADDGLRHANRLGIVYWQWQLSRVLAESQVRRHAAA